MKIITGIAASLLVVSMANANMAALNNCASKHNNDAVQAQLCMSKILFKAIKKGRRGGGGGQVGEIIFYHDDGRCDSSREVGRVPVTMNAARNTFICKNASASRSIWGVGTIINGASEKCRNISDTSDATKVCRTYIQDMGAPIN